MASIAEIQAIVEQIKNDLPLLINRALIAPKQIVTVTGLSDITERLGLVQAGEFRSGNGVEPGKGFTGVRMGYPAFRYGNDTYNIVGVNDDVIQFGLRAGDGKAIAGGGVVTLDSGGIQVAVLDSEVISRSYRIVDQNENTIIYFTGLQSAGVATSAFLNVDALDNAGANGNLYLKVVSDATQGGEAHIILNPSALGNTGAPTLDLYHDVFGNAFLDITNVSPNIDLGQTWNINGNPHNHDGENDWGWTPFAFPMSYSPDAAFTTAHSLPANGGTILIPIFVPTRMVLTSVSVRNTDTGTQRTWGWDLYYQPESTDNQLTRVAQSNADETFTPAGAATTRTSAVLQPGGNVVKLDAGLYWLAVQNRHATSTFGLGSTAASAAFGGNTAQTLTTTNPNGSTLSVTAGAGWTKQTAMYAVRLNGTVFANANAF